MKRVATEFIKNSLRKIAPICATNAKFKAWRTKAKYREVCLHYESLARERGIVYDETKVSERVAERLDRRGLRVGPLARGKLRILYLGTDEDQDTGGFLQSLQRFGQVYPFTQTDGSYGHWHYGGNQLENGRRLIELVKDALREGPLHLVLGQMWGHSIPWQTLQQIRRMGVITVNIAMDDRHAFLGRRVDGEWTGTKGLIPGLDLALTTAPEAWLWYAIEECAALFWPEASEPDIFHRIHVPKEHDVCFVGGNYGIRAKIVRAIQKRRFKVECFGTGWPNGRLATKDVPQLFARSKMVLGIGTIGYCNDFYSLKLRDFDATMSGSMYITHANPDLYGLFDVGKEIVCYRTPAECAEKCEYYLLHDEEREAIAKAGLRRAVRDHTWESRFVLLLQSLGLLEKPKTEEHDTTRGEIHAPA